MNKKVYKIITDQTSNLKSAFSNIIETVFPPIETSHQKVDEITKLLLDNLVEKDNFIDRKKQSEENIKF